MQAKKAVSRLLALAAFGLMLAPLPSAAKETNVMISAAIATGSREPDAGRALIQFLASPVAVPAITRSGMDSMQGSEKK